MAFRKGKDSLNSQLKPIITTSPLDYHLFRQEITSKYPAFEPPLPLIPIEPENTSVLPPLPNRQSRSASQDSSFPPNPPLIGGAQSIFQQPVHIATPAPSPPPSPAPGGGGKGQKKQNYQTNQNFPFLYSPLGESTNTLGGKGSTLLQDSLVGRHWDGSDVPASILEAGELFASRMRMSRALQQLWDVRESYIKFERGWEGFGGRKHDEDTIAKDWGLDQLGSSIEVPQSQEAIEGIGIVAQTDRENQTRESKRTPNSDVDHETDDERVQARLDNIESLYVSIYHSSPFDSMLTRTASLTSTASISCHCSAQGLFVPRYQTCCWPTPRSQQWTSEWRRGFGARQETKRER